MTVYVPQMPMRFNDLTKELEPLFNLGPAAVLGEIEYIFPTNDKNAMLLPQQAVNKARHALRNYSDEDYILPVGDPAAIGMVAATAAYFNNGRIKMLKWDRSSSQYITLSMNITGDKT